MNEPQTSDRTIVLTAATDRLSSFGKPPVSLAERKAADRGLEIAVSYVLQWGMAIASVIVLCGGAIYIWRHGSEPASFRVFLGEPRELCSPIGALQAAWAGRGRGWIQVGIMLLIATPIVRVALSWITFLRKQDWLYFAITSIVFGSLIYSFAGAYSY
ncbi:MAG: DUF1634 domain-containing protein [Oscillatoriales cyanobacterium]|nr:MAG: DUF1634 domain-containing protein [Oscillatoriales cyanobacterium]